MENLFTCLVYDYQRQRVFRGTKVTLRELLNDNPKEALLYLQKIGRPAAPDLQ